MIFGKSYMYSLKPVIVLTDSHTHYLARNKCRQGVSLARLAATSAHFSFLPVRKAGRGSEVFPWLELNSWICRRRFTKEMKFSHMNLLLYKNRFYFHFLALTRIVCVRTPQSCFKNQILS